MGTVPSIFAIGLTGTIASGKEEVAALFVSVGYKFFSLSDRVREEAARRGFQPPTREDLQQVGNELRSRLGSAVLADRTYQMVAAAGVSNAVVDGFRNPAEVLLFQEHTRFLLIAVDAPTEVRFERQLERRRPGDPQHLKDFLRLDARDRGVGESVEGQQVGACLQLAQFTIWNDSTLENLRRQFDALLPKIQQRPH